MKKISLAISGIKSLVNDFKLILSRISLKFQNFSEHPFCKDCAAQEAQELEMPKLLTLPFDLISLEGSGLGRKSSYVEFRENRCAWAFCRVHGCLNGQ